MQYKIWLLSDRAFWHSCRGAYGKSLGTRGLKRSIQVPRDQAKNWHQRFLFDPPFNG